MCFVMLSTQIIYRYLDNQNFCWQFRHASKDRIKNCFVWLFAWLKLYGLKSVQHTALNLPTGTEEKKSLCVVVGKTKKTLFNFKMHVQIILQKLRY